MAAEKCESSEAERGWCQLVFTSDSKPPMIVRKDSITVGRAADCDIPYVGNRFVSSHHCTISRDQDGKVWLEDSSTNGTLVNGSKVKNKQKVQISHNDQIQIVHKKEQPELDIAFLFQDLTKLEEESALLDNTQEYDLNTDCDSSVDECVPHSSDLKGNAPSEKRLREQSVGSESESSVAKKLQLDRGDKIEKEPEATTPHKPELVSHDSMAETLLCSICQDIFHDCISLQPCLHCFCASCYSQWMEHSSECPSCRNAVDRISRNHMVNNLVDAFVKAHPDKRRSEEEIKEMDAKNKITSDMLQPKKAKRLYDYDDDEDSYSDGTGSDDGDEASFGSELASGLPFSASPPTSFGGLFGFSFRPPPTICRQCPAYSGPSTCRPSTSACTAGDCSPSEDKDRSSSSAAPPRYTCSLAQIHIMCLCCMQPMPDRSRTGSSSSSASPSDPVPTQKCTVCHRAFCHMYWGCRRPDCLGCLNQLKDLNFGEKFLLKVLSNNTHESSILKDYLTDKEISLKDLQEKCLEKLDSKTYKSVDSETFNLTSTTVLCYKCGLRNFQDLCYQFRRDIPRDQLPESVTRRPDCYWGKNCRTQRTTPHHASRFNHICEQTRYT